MATTTAALAEHGMIMRQTRNPTRGVFYTTCAKSTGSTPEAQAQHYINQLGRKKRKLTGREQWIERMLLDGWVPMYRCRRYIDREGKRCEASELTAAPPGYLFRIVKNKPGY